MLDNVTKKNIDDCRDVLVGKVPDPKSQIEQITIALIYKFMDDMDKEAVEKFKGKPKFFALPKKTGDPKVDKKLIDYSKYGWRKLFDPKLGGKEMLELYSEALDKLQTNPNIPELFRNIFKNAYLPYRDPSTLKLFLKYINEFEYSHSEKLGDAFEYLLSVMGSQGDAGQFRTPRHIIDFVTACVNPQKNETVLDPACGTAGFLLSAYKHILKQNTDKRQGDKLTPDQRKKLATNFVGYDISPDMVRLSLANMYLHGFATPQIHEYDSLSSEDRWNETFDVILANPPFMTPKGGIRPHKKFGVRANKAEVLFTDYIAEHLNNNGRAGIIVPNGIVSTSQTAYNQLRKVLVESSLIAVISLPPGVFNPYSPVKTSILLLDKQLSKKTEDILFLKIENDGFDLGAQRKEHDKNDLPLILKTFENYIQCLRNSSPIKDLPSLATLVKKQTILNNKDVVLNGDRYLSRAELQTDFDKVKLVDVLDYEQPTKYIVETENYSDDYKTPVLTAGKSFILGYTNEANGIYKDDLPVIIFDDFTTSTQFVDFPFKVKSSAMKILKVKKDLADIRYLYYVMQNIEFNPSEHKRYWISQYSQIEIPLPSLEIQQCIVSEIEEYKSVIDGAKQVLTNYKPRININPEWNIVELGKYANIGTGGTPSKANPSFWNGNIPWVSPKDMKVDFIGDAEDHITSKAIESSSAKAVGPNTILIVVRSGILQHTIPIAITTNTVSFNQDIISINSNSKNLSNLYLFYYLKSTSQEHLKEGIKTGVTVQSFHNGYFKNLQIPLPPISEQIEIVNRIKEEQILIEGNKKLIELFEQKIKTKINEVWGIKANAYQFENEKLSMAAEP